MKDLLYISKRFWRQRWLLLCAAILTVVCCGAQLVMPNIMESIVNLGLLGDRMDVVRDGSVAILVSALVLAVAGFGTFMTGSTASERFALELRESLYEKITDLSVQQVEHIGAGGLVTRLTEDTTVCASLAEVLLQMLLEPVLLLVGGVVMMWRISHAFDAVFLVFVLIQCVLVLLFVRKTMPLFLKVLQKNDRLNGFLQSELRCLRLIKAYGEQQTESSIFADVTEDVRATQMNVRRWTVFFDPIILLVVNAAVGCLFLITGLQSVSGGPQVGSILAAMNYAEQILLSIVVSGKLFHKIAEARASASRLAELLRTQPAVESGNVPVPQDGLGDLALEHVSFRYGAVPVLEDISLTVPRGSFVAVCGRVGCGKTTLARLLCRVCDPSSGRILANGTDLKDFQLYPLRRHIAAVEKGMDIIEGTVADNIRYGRNDITDAQMAWAMDIAGVSDMLQAFPEGPDTPLPSLGTSLSGGERQRLALARALAGQPDILVLDDCTSSLDYASEGKILRAIRENCPDMTVILMTQRVLSLQQASLVVCIGDGGAAMCGTADELRATSPLFAQLCQSQEHSLC